ncbi:MAG: FUSC family protein [Rhizomicrobium sp.]
MAMPALDRRPGERIREWLGLLAAAPGRLEFATRQALICALTVLVVEIYQTPGPALTIYVVFFLNKADRAGSLVMNLVLLLLVTVVIALVTGVTTVVIDTPAWRVASIAALSFGLLFLASASKLRPVGAIIALIIGYALDLLGTLHIGEIATRALLYSWLFVGIPAGLSIAINLLIAPSPRRLVERALANRVRASAGVLRSPGTRAAFDACLEEGLGEVPEWLNLAGAEKSSPPQDIAALRKASQATTAVLLLTDLATGEAEASFPAALRVRVAGLLDEMAAMLDAGGYPVDVFLAPGEDEAGLAPAASAVLTDFRSTLSLFAEPWPPETSEPAPAAKAPGGFFLPDAFSNPEHVQYALKTTAAALFCYGLYTVLDWPGIHTCFITCYIVGLTTTAETIEKLTLRILGCLLGAGAGLAAIIYVIPSLTSIDALMGIVFAGAFVAAWIAAGSPRIAYAGFQLAFAFFLCVVQGPAPAFDMVVARDRVVGILIGNVVSYLVFVYVWPVSIAGRIDTAVVALLRGLNALAASPSLSRRRDLAASALAARGAIGREIGLVAYEPRRVRPSPDWVRRRSQALDGIAALTGPLLLATDWGPEASGGFAARLSRLASLFALPETATPDEQPIAAGAGGSLSAPWGLVDDRLTTLERAIAADAGKEGVVRHATA